MSVSIDISGRCYRMYLNNLHFPHFVFYANFELAKMTIFQQIAALFDMVYFKRYCNFKHLWKASVYLYQMTVYAEISGTEHQTSMAHCVLKMLSKQINSI